MSSCSEYQNHPKTPRHTRSMQDFNSVASAFSDIDNESNLMCPVHDCQRLGKYNSSSGRPRPILVTLNSTVQVSHVLAHPTFSALSRFYEA